MGQVCLPVFFGVSVLQGSGVAMGFFSTATVVKVVPTSSVSHTKILVGLWISMVSGISRGRGYDGN